jgi:ParB-like protein
MQRIAIKDIALDDDRRIGGKGSLETLKTSIEKVGLINPITVRKSKEGNFPYTIIAGRRRVEAAILLDWTEIDALVYETDEAADDSYFTHVALAENVNRLDLHPLDEGAQYARLLKESYSLEDLAAYFDRSISHIYQRMKLCNLIDDAREIFRNGQIKISTAAKIASLPKQIQKEIVSALKKELQWAGDHEKTIDRVIGQMMRMPLDFSCEACEQCTAKRTHYGNATLFPEYHDRCDYCMDSRCYEKNIRSFYQNEVYELLEAWGDAKAVYIYEEKSSKAEYLRSILDKKLLIETVPVHVFHESFEDCKNLIILDDDETDMLYSSSKNLKDCFPVLYFQEKYQEPILYIAVDDASYEKLFPSDSNEAEKAVGSGEEAETDGYDTSRDTDAGGNDNNNQAQNASGAEQATEGGVTARDWQTLTPCEQAEAFKRIFLEYLRQERKNIHHPLFYSPAYRHIMEIHVHFKEAFQIVTGVSLQDFYQQKRYEDLTYQQLLELYVYTDIIERGPYHFHRLKVVNGIPVVKAIDLSTDPWLALCADVLYHFLQEHTNVAPKETEQGQTEKKTVVTADTSA